MSKTIKNSDVPEKFDLRSHDCAAEKIQEILRLLPEVRTEGKKIDFERLKAVMGESVDAGKERYGMSWPGKVDCFKTIQTPSLGTLLPSVKESINFETTENMIIEGDNLEVLKLLQKSYLGKIKMIYIDPPYNTGNDFIYPDNYTESLQTYLEYSGQVDDEGKKFGTNTDTDGRFHSKWMNMMYPRLYLAKNLLREDGAIFISIDYRELSNLTRIMNDIFGEENLVGIISVVSNWKGRSDDKFVATANEFLVVYQKGSFQSLGLPLTEEYLSSYTERDANGKAFRLLGLRKRGAGAKRSDRPNMFYPFYVDPKTGEVSLEQAARFSVTVTPKLSDGTDGRWRWGKTTSKENISFLIAKKVSGAERFDVFEKDYAETEDGLRRIKPKSIWLEKDLSNEAGTLEYKELMGKIHFDNPKPTGLIRQCLSQSTKDNDIILDFFAGSGTTAHAVLESNAEEGSNRKFILVQLPEPCESTSAVFAAGFKTIADITKERVRRVINRMNEENADQLNFEGAAKHDRGFRVYKLAESNFKPWDAEVPHDPSKLERQLELHVNHIRDGRNDDDLLYEILIKSGFELTTSVQMLTLAGKNVYSVANGALFICLERHLSVDLIRALADKKPERIVCLDEGFEGNDQLKTNAVQIFKTKGITSFKTI